MIFISLSTHRQLICSPPVCMFYLCLSVDKTVISAFRLIPAHLVRKDETQTLPECMGSLVQLHISYTTHNWGRWILHSSEWVELFLGWQKWSHMYSRSQKIWANHCLGIKWGCKCFHTVVYTHMRKEKWATLTRVYVYSMYMPKHSLHSAVQFLQTSS